MPWSPRCQSSGESYGACQEHPEWPKQETVPKGREAVRCFLCAAECRRSRRLAVTGRGAWLPGKHQSVAKGSPSSTQLWFHLGMYPIPVAEILLPSDFLEDLEKGLWWWNISIDILCLDFLLKIHFRCFSCLFEMKLDFSIFHWWSFHIYVNALGFIISSLNLILCINLAFYSPYLFFCFGFLLNVSQTDLCSHPDFLGLCSHQVSLWIFKNCSIY